MIETDYHTIPANIFNQIESQANELKVSIDYFLMEFCQLSDGDCDWIKVSIAESVPVV